MLIAILGLVVGIVYMVFSLLTSDIKPVFSSEDEVQ